MSIARPYLYIGGPLHGQWLLTAPPPTVDGVKRPEGFDPSDPGPENVVRLDYCTTYRKRTVGHAPTVNGRLSSDEAYSLKVYVWEGISSPDEATTALGDAITHRFMVEHGQAVKPEDIGLSNGAPAQRIIVPGH